MPGQSPFFFRHFLLLVMTTTIVSCYTTTHLPTTFDSHPTASSLSKNNYLQLNEALRQYQAAAEHPWPRFSSHKLLKQGDQDKLIPLLRERLHLCGDLTTTNTQNDVFDPLLDQALRSFQQRHGLKPDGILGESTLAALNVSPLLRIKQIQINQQRWEALNDQLSGRYILVNIPAYNLSLYENDQRVLTMKVIVGKPQLQTPQLHSHLTRLVFYPYWHVPAKIAKKDILPKLQEDPEYLDTMNIKVIKRQSNTSAEVDEEDINWDEVETDHYLFRQDPGEKNALGIIKFEFPNPYDIYMHDTSAKDLFGQDQRDLSHGCVRLEKPFDLVSYLMKNDPTWNNEKLQQYIDDKKTTYVSIKQSIPIIITYLTAWVDEQGKLNFRDDIYHLDPST